MSRILINQEPFGDPSQIFFGERSYWPASWIDLPGSRPEEPSACLFKLAFVAPEAAVLRLHVSADNRYRLFLDGKQLGRGPERGDPMHWRYESYEVTLAAGQHTLVALTWWLAQHTPYAQMAVRPGFILASEGNWNDRLATGRAAWQAKLVEGLTFTGPGLAWGTGSRLEVDGALFPWDFEHGLGEGWQPALAVAPGRMAATTNETPPDWRLTPATLPPMKEEVLRAGRVRYLVEGEFAYPVNSARHLTSEANQAQSSLSGGSPLEVPPHTTATALIDLDNYYCAYPRLTVSGGKGATLAINWAEALYKYEPEPVLDRPHKGNRDEIEGKYFQGVGSLYKPDGGAHRVFEPLWWESGRYVEVVVKTANEPLLIEDFSLVATGYPLSFEGAFAASDKRLEEVLPLAVRVLQSCTHETYLDCPYYEQLMYVGDTRLQVLATYAFTQDDRLPRKAVKTFDESRQLSGFTQSRFPSKMMQIIPGFSLWWTQMVWDYWQWRDDAEFVRDRLPGVRAVLEGFRALLQADGLMGPPPSWCFVDWVIGWRPWGTPQTAEQEPSALFNLHFALSLVKQAEIEDWAGEPELALRNRKLARQLVDKVLERFWNEPRGLIADDLAQTSFSEHAQCLALLAGLLPEPYRTRVAEGLLTATDLHRTTIYFTHYLFETYGLLGRTDKLIDRMQLWFDLPALGFKTTLEEPEPSRSDCHAWGAHPVYHYFATLLGIRPASPGFSTVRIAPKPGPLTTLSGKLPHPQGFIEVDWESQDEGWMAEVTLPDGVTGVFVWEGQEWPLEAGRQQLSM